MSTEPNGTKAAPVTQTDRIQSIDVLRGFALLGILVMNIMMFSMPMAAYSNPTAFPYGAELSGPNYWVWHFTHLLADMKFMSIFSMLFGAGVILMTSRTEAKGKSSAGVHYRRMAILFLFGLVHAYLIWLGDILFLYACCGFWIFLFRKLWPAVQLIGGILMTCVVTGVLVLGSWWIGTVESEMVRLEAQKIAAIEEQPAEVIAPTDAVIPDQETETNEGDASVDPDFQTNELGDDSATSEDVDSSESDETPTPIIGDPKDPIGKFGMRLSDFQTQWDQQMAGWRPSEEQIAKEIEAHTTSYQTELIHRIPMAIGVQFFMLFFFGTWRAGGMMLIGMALYKWGVFNASRSNAFYLGMAILGLGIGYPLIEMGIARNVEAEFDLLRSMYGYMQFNYYGSIFVALGYIGVIMLLCKSSILGWLKSALAAVGQMALTNYLMHSIICTTLFYGRSGFGFKMFGELDRYEQVGVVIAVWIAQLIISPIWMKRFRFGPFEWLWRTMTYWKLQPMRR